MVSTSSIFRLIQETVSLNYVRQQKIYVSKFNRNPRRSRRKASQESINSLTLFKLCRMGQIPINFLTWLCRLVSLSRLYRLLSRNLRKYARTTTSSRGAPRTPTRPTLRSLTCFPATPSVPFKFRTYLSCMLTIHRTKSYKGRRSKRCIAMSWHKSSFASTCQKSIAPRTCAGRATIRRAIRKPRPSASTRTSRTTQKACAKIATSPTTTRSV